MKRTPGSECRETEFATVWQPSISSSEDRAGARAFDSQRGMARSQRAELVTSSAAYGPFEWVALGYLALSSALIVIFAANLARPLRVLSVQAPVALLIVALCPVELHVSPPATTAPAAPVTARRRGRSRLWKRR